MKKSTTQGFEAKGVTHAERLAMPTPSIPSYCFQTDSVKDSPQGLKLWMNGRWHHFV